LAQWGLAQWGLAQWGLAQWGLAQWGFAQWGLAQWAFSSLPTRLCLCFDLLSVSCCQIRIVGIRSSGLKRS